MSSICLRHCALVVSWIVNDHLLDGHVYAMLFLSKDREFQMRDSHHDLFALVGTLYGLRSDVEPTFVHVLFVHFMH